VRLRRLADEAAAAAEALDQAGRADLAAAEASSVALAAAGAAGFAAVDEAGNALLAPAELDALEARLAEDEAERVAIAGQLAEPDVAAALGRPAPDVAAVRASLEAATARHEELTARRHDAVARVSALERLVVELDHRLGLLRPVRERYEVVDGLSRLVEGTGSDNALRMRLSAFVLAARLEQVADAATERLVRMSGGRYSLVHTDAVGAGRGRSGLGLRVCDAWTGVTRDPATLSGGESFVASLALALGLADVVTAEAGGATLDTLFIDEGFGTLDEDALEEVVDVLDGLREGGRVVGVVSHVAELRQRIPAQLRIRKAVTGSSVELVAVAPSSMAPRMAVGARSGAA
jgi:exonuclease SbcC